MATEHPGIQLFLSNRLENLADALVHQMAKHPGHPLKPDTILIQNRGMTRWLNLHIANTSGIQMNSRYVYPRALLEELVHTTYNLEADSSPNEFSSEVLFWRIYSSLPKWAKHRKASALKRFLETREASTTHLRRYQLASRITHHFDQIQVYRPDLMASWLKQKEAEDWRSMCWKDLVETAHQPPPANLYMGFEVQLKAYSSSPEGWPDQLHLFAISSLPPIYLNILKAVSKWIPINIYLTQPSPLYWGDQLSKKKQLKAEHATDLSGHSLLGNLGKQGQDFLNTLIDAEVFAQDSSELFEDPGHSSLLHQLQKDLFELAAPPVKKTKAGDQTIGIHVCHSERREVEVLKDTLLSHLEDNPELKPDQIVIMAPDIKAYGPAIRSVFGPERDPKAIIPYSIADNQTGASGTVAHVLLSLLDLLKSRFSANDVMNFISIPAISDGFGFQTDDWNLIRNWILDTGIKWGIDEEHRQSATGISFDEYAWQPGIDRLVSGICIHPDLDSDWDSLLPHPDMEGSSLDLLNRFLELWQFVARNRSLSSKVAPVSNWLSTMRELIEFLFIRRENLLDECKPVIDLLNQLENEISNAGSDDPCDLRVIRTLFEDCLSQDVQAGSFFSGNVTFCSMMPMRNIPAKFIGMIGMKEDAYPRQDLNTEFSKFPDGPRIGDPSRRTDDRYLFLESILAAREQLYVSYPGIDSQTLNEESASIVVEELLDTLDEYFLFPDDQPARQALVSKETLQAFNPLNFSSNPPLSFSGEDLIAAEVMIHSTSDIQPGDLRNMDAEFEYPASISLSQFIAFFLNPSRYWLSERLDINFPFQSAILDETEPLESSGLQDFQWGNTILNDPDILSGKKEYQLRTLLPVGSLGKSAYERLQPQIRAMVDQWNAISSEVTATTHLDIPLDQLLLTGGVDGVSENNYKFMRFGKIRPHDLLAGWITHLCLSHTTGKREFTSHLIGKDATYSFHCPEQPKQHLTHLQHLLFKGHETALPFFPNASYAFSKATLQPSSRSKKTPLEIAASDYTKYLEYPFLIQGEAYDRYIQLCFPNPSEALSESFEQHALSVFTPLFDHLKGELP